SDRCHAENISINKYSQYKTFKKVQLFLFPFRCPKCTKNESWDGHNSTHQIDQLEVYKKKQDFFQSRIVKEIKFIFVVLRVNDKQVSI
ncbi:unnamed protein product, partial [Porites evermanni]